MATARVRSIVFSCVACLIAAGCTRDTSVNPALVDDFGNTLRLASAEHKPQRIVSLNPTTTEILFAIGAGPRVVGRSHYDTSPDSARLVSDLGNALRPNVEAVLAARPDLVLLYASEDNRNAASKLREARVNTLSLKIDRIADFARGVVLVGRATGDSAAAAAVRDSVLRSLARVRTATRNLKRPTVFWHVWDAPLITIGRGSFMTELVEIAGARNVYDDLAQPSPAVSIEDVARRNPDFILAGPEGAKQIQSDARWRVVRAARADDVLIADTSLVGRPSIKLGEASNYLAKLLHPGAVH